MKKNDVIIAINEIHELSVLGGTYISVENAIKIIRKLGK